MPCRITLQISVSISQAYYSKNRVTQGKSLRVVPQQAQLLLWIPSFSFFLKNIYFYLCVSVCVWVCAHESRCSSKPEEGISSLGSGDPGGSEPPDLGIPEQT